MIRTTDLNYAAILIASGLGRLTKVLPPQDGERLITFELAASEANLEKAHALEHAYNELTLEVPSGAIAATITLGDFLDGIQRARRAMRGAQAVQR